MSQTVIGIFNNATEANNAVSQLISNGFSEQDVDIMTGKSGDYNTEGYATGSTDTGTSETGVSRFFKNLFGNADESERYSTAAEKGTVVTVHAKSSQEAQQAAALLDQYGATNVDDDDTYDRDDATYTGSDTTAYTGNDTAAYAGSDAGYDSRNTTGKEDQKISVIEENLQVGKRQVETGGVRIKSRIVEKPVEESLRLREEHVSVQRNKVNRVVTDADLNNFKESTIELTEHAEVPVVSKEARVVEEISVGKQVSEREETIHDTVRKTEVDIEETGKKNNK